MADFKQAVEWKVEGKEVYHQRLKMILSDDCLSMSDIDGDVGKSLDSEDLHYEYWQIYKQNKSLSDKIIFVGLDSEISCFDDDNAVIQMRDVKEFIKLVRQLLDDTMSGGCDRGYVLGKFDKLAGDRLI